MDQILSISNNANGLPIPLAYPADTLPTAKAGRLKNMNEFCINPILQGMVSIRLKSLQPPILPQLPKLVG
jgi:hypothetical protein